uniref:Uncharacterized protein n=1 Tax=Aegilops tauschii subsp. strangulata TaxID=200361 RepID=A0A453PEN8_AEGTS
MGRSEFSLAAAHVKQLRCTHPKGNLNMPLGSHMPRSPHLACHLGIFYLFSSERKEYF